MKQYIQSRLASLDRRTLALGVALVAAVYLVYLPSLVTLFDYHDSFYFFVYDSWTCTAHPQAYYAIFTGRPLLVPFICATAIAIDNISDAFFIRVLALAVMSGTGLWILRALRASGVPGLVGVAAVVMMAAVPGWLNMLSVTLTSSIVVTVPLTFGAFVLVDRIADAGWGRPSIGMCAKAVLLLMLAALIYQQTTALLFAFCVVPVVLSPLVRARRVMTVAVAVYAVHGLAYLAVHHLVTLPLLRQAMGAAVSRFSAADPRFVALSTDVAAKVRLFTAATPQAFSLSFLDPPEAVPLAFGLLALAAAIAVAARELLDSRRLGRSGWGALGGGLERLGLIALLVPLSVAPVMLASGSFIVYRVLIGYQWLIVLFLAAAATGLARTAVTRRLATVAAIGIAVAAGLSATRDLDRNLAGLNGKELAHVASELENARSRLPAHLVVVQPDVLSLGDFRPGVDFVDEFGKTSTMYPNDVRGVVYATMARLNLPGDSVLSISVARADASGQIHLIDGNWQIIPNAVLPPEPVLIDMRPFEREIRENGL